MVEGLLLDEVLLELQKGFSVTNIGVVAILLFSRTSIVALEVGVWWWFGCFGGFLFGWGFLVVYFWVLVCLFVLKLGGIENSAPLKSKGVVVTL